ncbi:hypothetical protein KFL_002570020 [Klebsormidium nitens]|uniref:APO domain-containing protein n=1 Tax=Klebsormidium nitens TaxID=105231 RepID=A0A1Y1I4H1_KLENI|nr:hypothetical protein KFL_002570020 [Klebsormidium nitens]|eukprot:GAQ85834.1 hypothetical protein KFL_002570020 [Klebsormidium nitens]
MPAACDIRFNAGRMAEVFRQRTGGRRFGELRLRTHPGSVFVVTVPNWGSSQVTHSRRHAPIRCAVQSDQSPSTFQERYGADTSESRTSTSDASDRWGKGTRFYVPERPPLDLTKMHGFMPRLGLEGGHEFPGGVMKKKKQKGLSDQQRRARRRETRAKNVADRRRETQMLPPPPEFTDEEKERVREAAQMVVKGMVIVWQYLPVLLYHLPVQVCRHCTELHVGPNGHSVRSCRGIGSEARQAAHEWRRARFEDILPISEAFHLWRRDAPPPSHKLQAQWGRVPAVMELCFQAGADVPGLVSSAVEQATGLHPTTRLKILGISKRALERPESENDVVAYPNDAVEVINEAREVLGFPEERPPGPHDDVQKVKRKPKLSFMLDEFRYLVKGDVEKQREKDRARLSDPEFLRRLEAAKRAGGELEREIDGGENGSPRMGGAIEGETEGGGFGELEHSRRDGEFDGDEAGTSGKTRRFWQETEEERVWRLVSERVKNEQRSYLAQLAGFEGEDGLGQDGEGLDDDSASEEEEGGEESADVVSAERTSDGGEVSNHYGEDSDGDLDGGDWNGDAVGGKDSDGENLGGENSDDEDSDDDFSDYDDEELEAERAYTLHHSAELETSRNSLPADVASSGAATSVSESTSGASPGPSNAADVSKPSPSLGVGEGGSHDGSQEGDPSSSQQEGNPPTGPLVSRIAWRKSPERRALRRARRAAREKVYAETVQGSLSLRQVAENVLLARQVVVDNLPEILQWYDALGCRFCSEVHVGPRGHRVRTCRGRQHPHRKGAHDWRPAGQDELFPPLETYHMDDVNALPPQHLEIYPLKEFDPEGNFLFRHEPERKWTRWPVIVEMCVQAGAQAPEEFLERTNEFERMYIEQGKVMHRDQFTQLYNMLGYEAPHGDDAWSEDGPKNVSKPAYVIPGREMPSRLGGTRHIRKEGATFEYQVVDRWVRAGLRYDDYEGLEEVSGEGLERVSVDGAGVRAEREDPKVLVYNGIELQAKRDGLRQVPRTNIIRLMERIKAEKEVGAENGTEAGETANGLVGEALSEVGSDESGPRSDVPLERLEAGVMGRESRSNGAAPLPGGFLPFPAIGVLRRATKMAKIKVAVALLGLLMASCLAVQVFADAWTAAGEEETRPSLGDVFEEDLVEGAHRDLLWEKRGKENERYKKKDRHDDKKDRYDDKKDRYEDKKDRYDDNKDRKNKRRDDGKDGRHLLSERKEHEEKSSYDNKENRYDNNKDRNENKDRKEKRREKRYGNEDRKENRDENKDREEKKYRPEKKRDEKKKRDNEGRHLLGEEYKYREEKNGYDDKNRDGKKRDGNKERDGKKRHENKERDGKKRNENKKRDDKRRRKHLVLL